MNDQLKYWDLLDFFRCYSFQQIFSLHLQLTDCQSPFVIPSTRAAMMRRLIKQLSCFNLSRGNLSLASGLQDTSFQHKPAQVSVQSARTGENRQ